MNLIFEKKQRYKKNIIIKSKRQIYIPQDIINYIFSFCVMNDKLLVNGKYIEFGGNYDNNDYGAAIIFKKFDLIGRFSFETAIHFDSMELFDYTINKFNLDNDFYSRFSPWNALNKHRYEMIKKAIKSNRHMFSSYDSMIKHCREYNQPEVLELLLESKRNEIIKELNKYNSNLW